MAGVCEGLGGPGRGQVGVGAPGDQIAQQRVQLVDQPGPLRGQVGPTLVQQCQHRGQVLGSDRGGVTGQRGHARRRGSVDDIVLAAPATGELPHPGGGGGGGRNVLDLLAAGNQPLRPMAAQAAGVLHRPPPILEPGRPAQ